MLRDSTASVLSRTGPSCGSALKWALADWCCYGFCRLESRNQQCLPNGCCHSFSRMIRTLLSQSRLESIKVGHLPISPMEPWAFFLIAHLTMKCSSTMLSVETSHCLPNDCFHGLFFFCIEFKDIKIKIRFLSFLGSNFNTFLYFSSSFSIAFIKENIARSQKASPSTSHQLSRRQVVLTKRVIWVLSEIKFFSFVTIWA